jgi:hypothetical protein
MTRRRDDAALCPVVGIRRRICSSTSPFRRISSQTIEIIEITLAASDHACRTTSDSGNAEITHRPNATRRSSRAGTGSTLRNRLGSSPPIRLTGRSAATSSRLSIAVRTKKSGKPTSRTTQSNNRRPAIPVVVRMRGSAVSRCSAATSS